jgi:hypothetical protein
MLSSSFVAAPKVRDIKVPPAAESSRFLEEKFSPAVIAIFWPNKEMGRNQDGLGGYTCNTLLDRPCAKIWAELPVYLYNIMLEYDSV